MPMLTSEEERKKQERSAELRLTFRKFFEDFLTSFKIWIKIAGILDGILIIGYLFARFIVRWDAFYETQLDFTVIFFLIALFFLIILISCWLVAFFLYNTHHRRNTKYKTYDVGRGGERGGR